MGRLGIVTGLASEMACLVWPKSANAAEICCAAADSGQAERAAGRLLDQGCDSLLSFGMAGGLAPDLKPGAVIIPQWVLSAEGDAFSVDEHWRARLAGLLRAETISGGDIVGSTELVASAAAKQQLRRQTWAAAVDMESLALGRVAHRAGIPFLVLRVIADPAHRAPPPWTMTTVGAEGCIRIPAALWALLRHPADLPTAMGLARDSRIALTALRRVAMSAGPLFGL